jgi:hypothetical protein
VQKDASKEVVAFANVAVQAFATTSANPQDTAADLTMARVVRVIKMGVPVVT